MRARIWLALCCGVAAMVFPAAAGGFVFAGSTEQGRSVTLLAGSGGRIVNLKISWVARCRSGGRFSSGAKVTFKSHPRRRLVSRGVLHGHLEAPYTAYTARTKVRVAGSRSGSTRWTGTLSASTVVSGRGHVIDRCSVTTRWHATTPAARLAMQSDAGDYIGAGLDHRYAAPGQPVSVASNGNEVTVNMGGWALDFSAAGHQRLHAGSYLNAERYPFNGSHPGLSIYGDGRGCNTDTGSFTVKALKFARHENVSRFAVSFVQHCEGEPAALHGSFSYSR